MITLTTNAVAAIKAALSRAPEANAAEAGGLRVVAKAGARSGVRYMMHLDSAPRDGDVVIEQGGLKVFVDRRSRAAIRGICIDFVETESARGFVFEEAAAVPMPADGGLRN